MYNIYLIISIGVDDWVSACRNVVVAGVRCVGRGRKTWGVCVKDDIVKLLGLQPEWAIFRDVWRDFVHRVRLGLENMDVLKINGDDGL